MNLFDPLLLLVLLLILPLTLAATPSKSPTKATSKATSKAVPKATPYALANPLDQMDLEIYSGNASQPCDGFLALKYSSPIPVNETDCVAVIASTTGRPLRNLICVKRKKQDVRMDKCEMWGYLDGKCGGVPVIAGRQAQNASWVWGLGTGLTVPVRSFKVSC